MDFLDFFDLFDLVLEPIFDLLLCRGNLDVWSRKRISDFILGAGNLIFLVILAAGIHSSSVFLDYRRRHRPGLLLFLGCSLQLMVDSGGPFRRHTAMGG